MDLYGFTPGILENRSLRPILQKMHPLSARSVPRTSRACAGRVGGEKGFEIERLSLVLEFS